MSVNMVLLDSERGWEQPDSQGILVYVANLAYSLTYFFTQVQSNLKKD